MAADAGTDSTQASRPRRDFDGLGTAALVLAVFITFLPALSGGFIWDDDTHVTANPRVVGPLGLREIWSTTAANYFPLVLTHFRLLHALWGLNPLPYHAVNLALHALGAILCWRVLRRLHIPGAWLGAALWALHPVQVESVAWISELKNTQSGVFYLLAIWFFLQWVGRRETESSRMSGPSYGLALLCAALAILSKPSTVMLPVALALCWWWRKREWRWSAAAWLAPFLALSAAASLWTIWEQKFHAGAVGAEWSQTWPERVVIAGRAVWFYLGKLLWPHPTIFMYPRWAIDARAVFAFAPFMLAAAVLLVAWVRRRSGAAAVFFALGYFVALLFPVLGFFNVYYFRYSFVADHFQYLASMGPLALVAAGIGRLVGAGGRWRPPVIAFAAILLVALAATSHRESHHYRNDEALFRSVIARNPGLWAAHNNLGNALVNQNRIDEAFACYTEALRLKPDDPDALNNVGSVLAARGDAAGAIAHFERALRLQPEHFDAHNNLATALASAGRWDDAVRHYAEALRLNPNYAKAHYNWGNDLFRRGEYEGAVKHYRAAVAIDAGFTAAHYNLGVTLGQLGQTDAAVAEYERALALKSDYAEAHHNLALLLQTRGNTAAALAHYRKALEIQPDFLEAYNNLGALLRKMGRPADAIRCFEQALRLQPNGAEIQFNLSLALRDAGRIDEARSRYESARRLNPKLPEEKF